MTLVLRSKNTDEGVSDTALGFRVASLLTHASEVVQCITQDETLEGQVRDDVLEDRVS